MFDIDVKRIKACIEYNDYHSALEYANLIKDKYTDSERRCLEELINYIQSGNHITRCGEKQRPLPSVFLN